MGAPSNKGLRDCPPVQEWDRWVKEATMTSQVAGLHLSADRSVVLDRVRRGLIRYSRFERRIEAVRVSGDLAVVMGSDTVVRKGNEANAGPTVQRRFTNIWRLTGGSWRLIARHANVIAGS
jgi:hypothetical protein